VLTIQRHIRAYCTVISAGQESYDVEAGRRPAQAQPVQPPPTSFTEAIGRSVDSSMQSTGSKCAAEIYCCCFPVFLICLILSPIIVLFDLLFCVGILQGGCYGFAVGCGPFSGFCSRLSDHFHALDRRSSSAAFYDANACRFFGLRQEIPQSSSQLGTGQENIGNSFSSGATPPNSSTDKDQRHHQHNNPPVAIAEPIYY